MLFPSFRVSSTEDFLSVKPDNRRCMQSKLKLIEISALANSALYIYISSLKADNRPPLILRKKALGIHSLVQK